MVDELGLLEKELAPYAGKIARIECLRRNLRAHVPGAPAARTFELEGERFIALVGARGHQTVIDYANVAKLIGTEAYAKFATCTLKDLQAHVAPGLVAYSIRTEQAGPRSLKVIERGQR